jgi:dihydrofolate reductase
MEQDYPNVEVSSNLNQVIERYQNNDQELVVIGGKKIFDSLMDQVDKLVISMIKDDYSGDTYAPE